VVNRLSATDWLEKGYAFARADRPEAVEAIEAFTKAI